LNIVPLLSCSRVNCENRQIIALGNCWKGLVGAQNSKFFFRMTCIAWRHEACRQAQRRDIYFCVATRITDGFGILVYQVIVIYGVGRRSWIKCLWWWDV